MDTLDPHPIAAEVEAYLVQTGMSPSRFGQDAVQDPNFVRDLRLKAREPRRSTVKKVRDFIAENPPGASS